MSHEHHNHANHSPESFEVSQSWTRWIPLAIIFSYIAGLTVLTATIGSSSLYAIFSYLMGYFFIIFSLFKMIDIPAFAMGYQEYDIIAQRIKAWGYVYPFVELTLGILYVLTVNNPILHIITIVLSLLICASVLIKLAKHETFQCVCLGTILKVPLTIVSLVEYAVMGIMALVMLLGLVS